MIREEDMIFIPDGTNPACSSQKPPSEIDTAKSVLTMLASPTVKMSRFSEIVNGAKHITNPLTMKGCRVASGILSNISVECSSDEFRSWISSHINEIVFQAFKNGSCSVMLDGEGNMIIDPTTKLMTFGGKTIIVPDGIGQKEVAIDESRVTLILDSCYVFNDDDKKIYKGGTPAYIGGILEFVQASQVTNANIDTKSALSSYKTVLYTDNTSVNPALASGILTENARESGHALEEASSDNGSIVVNWPKESVDVIKPVMTPIKGEESREFVRRGMASGPVGFDLANGGSGLNRDIYSDMTANTISEVASNYWPSIVKFVSDLGTMYFEFFQANDEVSLSRNLHPAEYIGVASVINKLTNSIFTVNELREIAAGLLDSEFQPLNELDDIRT